MPHTVEAIAQKGGSNDQSSPRRILFVCTGNTCRSPMAAALLNHLVRPREICSACADLLPPLHLVASSAGLYAVEGMPITPAAVEALRAAGVVPTEGNNYPAHTACAVTAEMMEEADEVIAITGRHAMELILRYPEHAAKVESLPMDIADPYGGSDAVYRECLDMLSYAITLRWLSGSNT